MGDLILSEVHLEKNAGGQPVNEAAHFNEVDGNKVYLSRFKIKCPDGMLPELRERFEDLQEDESEHSMGVEYDEEGDMLLPRRACVKVQLLGSILSIPIYHSMASALDSVGLQVWTGCFLMIDYVLENHSHFCGKKVLELGGGTGLASFVVGMLADSVVVTDMGGSPLELCAQNYGLNCNLLKEPSAFRVAELDWTKSVKHIKVLDQKPDIILACDVIYDNDLTDAFFRTLYRLLSQPVYRHGDDSSIEVLMSTEKRLNFTVAELDVTCNEYEHFLKCLSELEDELSPHLSIEKLDTQHVGSYCEYKRTRYVEIWRLVIARSNCGTES